MFKKSFSLCLLVFLCLLMFCPLVSQTSAADMYLNPTAGYAIMGDSTAAGNVMTIRSSGNVGIGTAGPSENLVVYEAGNARVHIDGQNNNTDLGNHGVGLSIINRDGTTNNWGSVVFRDGNLAAASIEAQYINRTSGFADINLATRAVDGWQSRLVVKSSGNVGIGTTAPGVAGAILQVNGVKAGTQATTEQVFRVVNTGNEFAKMVLTNGANWDAVFNMVNNAEEVYTRLQIHVGNAADSPGGEGISITGSGNVGIGTTAPTRLLSLNAAQYPYMSFNEAGAEGWVIGYEGAALDRFAIYGGTPGGSKDYRMTILDNGNVGIGTTGPASKLEVAGTVHSTTGGFKFPDGTIQTTAGGGVSSQWTTNGTSIYYNTGNVGIGTTGPQFKLEVANGSINAYDSSTLSSELTANDWRNHPTIYAYETFLSSGSDITSAINTSGYASATDRAWGGGVTYVTPGDRFIVTGTLTLNSGQAPLIELVGTPWNTGNYSTSATLTNGAFSVTLIGIEETANAALVILNDAPTNFSISNLSMKRVTGGNIIARGLFTGGGANGLKVSQNGNVGIGTTAPATVFHVVSGNLAMRFPNTDGGNTGLQLEDSGTGHAPALTLKNSGTGGRIYRIASYGANPGYLVIRDDSAAADRLVIDNSGNVGIGTTGPAATLGVNGDIKFGYDGSAIYPGGRLYTSAGTMYIEQLVTGASMQFKTNSAEFVWNQGANERMRIDTSGNVGIGTTAPGTALHVSKDTGAGNWSAIFTNTNATRGAGIKVLASTYSAGEPMLSLRTGSETEKFGVDSDGKTYIAGNVGIGTTAPGAKLDVQTGNIRVYSGDGSTGSIEYKRTSDSWHSGTIRTVYGGGYGSSLYFDVHPNDGVLATAPVTKMVIQHDGNVGIGTTGPGRKLTVASGDIQLHGEQGIYWWNSPNNDNSAMGRIVFTDGANGGNLHFYTNTSEKVRINSAGKVGIGTTAPNYQLELSTDSAAKPTTNTWTIASDKRVKKNITDFEDGLDVVMKLIPRIYQYNGLGGPGYDDTATHIGFVAQEIESATPYMVETRHGTIGGKEVSDFKSYQGHALPFILVNAIKEQQNEIDNLRVQIEALKQVVARLDNEK